MSDIFLSFAREDRNRAALLAHALRDEGFSVWWDRSIPAGARFNEIIERALSEARCVIVLWSEQSVRSEWVLAEAHEGRNQGKLIPVLLDDVRPPYGFLVIHHADLRHWEGDIHAVSYQYLLEGIRHRVTSSKSAVVHPETALPPPSRKETGIIGSVLGWFRTLSFALRHPTIHDLSTQRIETSASSPWDRLLTSANAGDPRALYALAFLYRDGQGVEQDLRRAAQLFRQAADTDYIGAQYALGRMYYEGWGVDQDTEAAVKWWKIAADNGHTGARFTLGALAWRGGGREPSNSEALKWWQLASGGSPVVNRRSVFVCYTRSDQGFVLPLAEALREQEVPIWLDQWDIPASADWDKTIDNALYTCTEFLIILSPAAVESDEVRAELRVALSEQKPIVPVLYKECRIPRRLLLTQRVDFTIRQPNDRLGVSEIVTALNSSPARQSA
jgi:hypothetical protein